VRTARAKQSQFRPPRLAPNPGDGRRGTDRAKQSQFARMAQRPTGGRVGTAAAQNQILQNKANCRRTEVTQVLRKKGFMVNCSYRGLGETKPNFRLRTVGQGANAQNEPICARDSQRAMAEVIMRKRTQFARRGRMGRGQRHGGMGVNRPKQSQFARSGAPRRCLDSIGDDLRRDTCPGAILANKANSGRPGWDETWGQGSWRTIMRNKANFAPCPEWARRESPGSPPGSIVQTKPIPGGSEAVFALRRAAWRGILPPSKDMPTELSNLGKGMTHDTGE